MKFIISSKQLADQAKALEAELGERCYIPSRDTPQTTGDSILPDNLKALMESDEDVYVFWDGGSLGTMFDMGMAYALGKKLIPKALIGGRNWQEYFSTKIGSWIKYEG